jgi:hypothetical protein
MSSSSVSDDGSNSAVSNPTLGRHEIQNRLCSVLSHPLCIPLLCVMHNQQPVVADNGAVLTFSGLLEETRDLVQESTKVLFNAVLENSLRNDSNNTNETVV